MASSFEQIERLSNTVTSLEERIHALEGNRLKESRFSYFHHFVMLVAIKPFAGMVKVCGYALALDLMNCAVGMIAASAQPTAEPCLMLKNGWKVCPPPSLNGAHTRTDFRNQ